MPTPDFTHFPIPTVQYVPVAPGGSAGQVQVNNGSGGFSSLTNAQLTMLITPFSVNINGAVPGPNAAPGTTFLRDDGIWAVPSGGGGGGDPLSLGLGFTLDVVNPQNDFTAGHSANVGFYTRTQSNNLNNLDPQFTNIEANHLEMTVWNADATYIGSTNAKTTQYVLSLVGNFYSGGQRFLQYNQAFANGMGDFGIWNVQTTFAGGPIPGDEGIGYSPIIRLSQTTEDLRTTISSVHRALGNTTITPAIVRSRNPQTVAVASTANINAGEWYVVNQQAPTPYYNTEAVQIISVGAGTITARFRVDHAAVTTLTPALVFNHNSGSPGQLRVIVNLSGAVVNAGQMTGAPDQITMTGSGTAFANNMVGGTAKNIGAICMAKDTYTSGDFSVGNPCKSWYEIGIVNSATSLDIVAMSVANDQAYHSTRGTFPTNYEIRPAVRILYMPSPGTVVCESTSTVWNNGDTIEIARCPYPDMTLMDLRALVYTSGATYRNGLSISNDGPTPCTLGAGLVVGSSAGRSNPGDKDWTWDTGVQAGNAFGKARVGICTVSSEVGLLLDALSGHIGNAPIVFGQSGAKINENTNTGMTFSYGGGSAFDIVMSGVGSVPNPNPNHALLTLNQSNMEIKGLTNIELPYIALDGLKMQRISGVDVANRNAVVETCNSTNGIQVARTQISGAGLCGATFSNSGLGTNGAFQTARSDVILSNGANGNVQLVNPTSFIRVSGPTAAFSVSGFIQVGGGLTWGLSGHNAGDGTVLRIFNSTAQNMTLLNDAGTNSGILTLTGADVVLTGVSAATLIFSGVDQRWILMGTQG